MGAAVVRRSDVPNSWESGLRAPVAPKARINKTGTLYFSVAATEVIGDRDCRVMVEFDETARTLKFTNAGQNAPVPGISLRDLFLMRIRINRGSRSPTAMISIRALLKHVGFDFKKEAMDFEIAALDPKNRSVTVALPQEE